MKYFCIGRNYADHIQELQNEKPTNPVVFLKPQSALYKGKKYLLPTHTNELHYECELILRIGENIEQGQNIIDWKNCIDAMTLGIDFTARDTQRSLKEKGLPWEISKAFDGSVIEGEWLDLECFQHKNNYDFTFYESEKLLQHGKTEMMIYPIIDIMNYLLRYFSFQKGDVIFTGTPAGVGLVKKNMDYKGILEDKPVLSFST